LTEACQGAYQASGYQASSRPQAAFRSSGRPGGLMANPFLWLISTLIWTYIYILFAAVIMSWLIAFNVVNTRNQFVGMVADFLYRVTEPALRPIRRRMPTLGGIDLSPAILIIGLMFFEQLVYWIYAKAFR
jgi:YggT family protein